MDKVQQDRFTLIGLKLPKQTTNEGGQSGIDCGNLWQQFEVEKWAEKIPGKVDAAIYAVYYDYVGDHTKPYSYFIGCRVEEGTEAPVGMERLVVAGGSYTKITTKGQMLDCVANAWREIWRSNMERVYQFDFEIYDERSKDWGNAEVDIYLSAK
jgi:predicted transcriptional regulator YdeE